MPLYVYYKQRLKGAQRWRWLIPEAVGFFLTWAGYLMRREAFSEMSWALAARGSILEILGELAVLYSIIVLFRIPKDQR